MSFGTACRRVGLKGRDVMNGPLRTVFKDAYASHFMKEIHVAFWNKALGGSDRFGETWKELTQATIEIKQKMLNEVPGEEEEYQRRNAKGQKAGKIQYTVTSVPHISGIYSHRQYLSPDQRKVYEDAARGGHRSTRARRGLASVQHEEMPENASIINVRSGRLSAALAPVTASRGRLYQEGPESSYSWGEYYGYPKLIINITVPYAGEVHEGHERVPPRPILPDRSDEMVIHKEAIEMGLQEVLRHKQILERKRL